MSTSTAVPTPAQKAGKPRFAGTRSLIAGIVLGLLLGVVMGAVLFGAGTVGVDPRDPSSQECSTGFEAFAAGERTPSLLQIVNECTAEAR